MDQGESWYNPWLSHTDGIDGSRRGMAQGALCRAPYGIADAEMGGGYRVSGHGTLWVLWWDSSG